jgi:hypothetical protein
VNDRIAILLWAIIIAGALRTLVALWRLWGRRRAACWACGQEEGWRRNGERRVVLSEHHTCWRGR